MDGIRFYLVLEKRLGDYNVINIPELDIYNNEDCTTLSQIDTFTSKYTKDELISSIKRGNLVREEYLSGKLRVISEYKHNFGVLTKKEFNVISEFPNMLINDKQLLNNIYNIYKSNIEKVLTDKMMIDKFLSLFRTSLNENDFIRSMQLIEQLPYLRARSVYFYLYKLLK
jgi:hypothetical protein